jgi:hypothetical protein
MPAIPKFRWQIAAGALMQTNTTLFATLRIFLHFSWICFHGKNWFIKQVNENTLVTLFERVTWPLLFLLQKVSNSFLQNAKGD